MKEYRLGLYEKSMPNNLDLSEKLCIAKQTGFDYLELSIDESDEKLGRLDWHESEIKRIKKAMDKNQVYIGSICLSGHRKYPLGDPNLKTREKSLEIMEKAIVLAYKLGVRYIQLAGYDVYYLPSNDRTREFFYKGLKKSVEIASSYGVVLGFETMETPFLNTVEKGMYWVNLINSPYLKIYPDVGNLTNAYLDGHTTVKKDLASGNGHIIAMHLKETMPGVYREVVYGKGHVDFANFLKEARTYNIRSFVGEFWYVGQENWLENIKDNNLFLRNLLDKEF